VSVFLSLSVSASVFLLSVSSLSFSLISSLSFSLFPSLSLSSLSQVLAQIHSLRPDAVGLQTFGKSENYVARQLKQWVGQYEKNKSGFTVPPMERLAAL
jgi:aminoglycoside phosphotransferase (APT) family kinase protein